MFNNSNIATLYVSQEYGSDAYTGFCCEKTGNYQGPLKTIEAALERVRNLRAIGARQPVSIVIIDKTYFVEKPILIDNSLELVTIKGRKDTVISGGYRVTGFQHDTFHGKACFSVVIPQVNEGAWFTDFYVDGMRADYTSIPKDGFFGAQSVENEGEAYDSESKWFIANPEDLVHFRSLRNFEDCMISFYHFWVDEHTPIERVDFETGRIDMRYRSRFAIGAVNPNAKMRYKLENVAEAFENPNEWYLDRTSAKLYYIPRDEKQTPESIEAYLPVSEKLFVIQGEKNKQVNYITFSDLTFANTRGDYNSRIMTNTLKRMPDDAPGYACDEQAMCSAYGAIEFRYAHDCAVEHCKLENLGLHGITVNEGCDNIRIYGNRFHRLGGGAVKICGGAYGCEKEDETWGNVVSQNHISHCGRRYYASCGIMIMHGYGNTISHNEIGYLYYTGISCGWEWGYQNNITKENLIEKNHVHHIGQGRLSDMGAIYLLGVQPGTIVRNNIVHDVQGYKYGGTGIYTDEGSAYILIEKNIVYNIHSGAYNHHFGRMNTVRNNIFAKAGRMMQASRPELHTGLVTERNILVSEGLVAYGFGYKQEGPCCGNVNMIGGSYNLHFDTSGKYCLFDLDGNQYDLERAQREFGLEIGSMYADPKFLDYENNDFRLADDSPAYALGFEAIDTSDIGITITLKK